MFDLSGVLCKPGEFFNWKTEVCNECEENSYNHGGMPNYRHECYKVPEDSEYIYKDKFSVECKKGWKGNPIYHDGEYECGCIDADDDFITHYEQVGDDDSKCVGEPIMTHLQLTDDILDYKCAELCTKENGCCTSEDPCKRCCFSFAYNKSLCYGFSEKNPDIDYADNFKCFALRHPPTAFSAPPSPSAAMHRKSTRYPSRYPTKFPSAAPSLSPSICYLSTKTALLTSACMKCMEDIMNKSLYPSVSPTFLPSSSPSLQPTSLPSLQPTSLPSLQPTSLPSLQPTSLPSLQPPHEHNLIHTYTPSTESIACENGILIRGIPICWVGWIILLSSFASMGVLYLCKRMVRKCKKKKRKKKAENAISMVSVTTNLNEQQLHLPPNDGMRAENTEFGGI